MTNLNDLIRPLRAKYLRKLVPILILCPSELKHSAWEQLALFEAILYFRGSGLEESELRRAGIYKASRVLVLSDAASRKTSSEAIGSDESIASTVATQSLVDADAVFIHQLIRRMNDKAKISIEIIHPTNISYLDRDNKGSKAWNIKYRNSPHFAAGFLFTTSALDTLVCQVKLIYKSNVL